MNEKMNPNLREDYKKTTDYTANFFHKHPDAVVKFYEKDINAIAKNTGLDRDIVDRDVQRVLGDYVINSAATITRVGKFGIDRRAFEKTFLSPIKAELREAGIDGAELADIMARVEELYTKTTGIEKQGCDQIRSLTCPILTLYSNLCYRSKKSRM